MSIYATAVAAERAAKTEADFQRMSALLRRALSVVSGYATFSPGGTPMNELGVLAVELNEELNAPSVKHELGALSLTLSRCSVCHGNGEQCEYQYPWGSRKGCLHDAMKGNSRA